MNKPRRVLICGRMPPSVFQSVFAGIYTALLVATILALAIPGEVPGLRLLPRAVGAIAGVLFATWSYRRKLRNYRVATGRCLHCGYDLRASTDRCPECGEPINSRRSRNAPGA